MKEPSHFSMADSNPIVMLTQGQLREMIRQEIQAAMTCSGSSGKCESDMSENSLATKPYLTVAETAKLSGLGVSTVRAYIRKGILKRQKVGRRIILGRAEFERFLGAAPA
jgi:excisionase family DNA binding protein